MQMSKNVNNDVSMNPPIDVSISKNTALSTLNLPVFIGSYIKHGIEGYKVSCCTNQFQASLWFDYTGISFVSLGLKNVVGLVELP